MAPNFAKPHHFTKDADGWLCNVCNPSNGDHAPHMTIHAAIRHERESAQHARNVQESEMWWNPPTQDPAIWEAPIEEDPPLTREELQRLEHQYHVERVADIVPYWIKCVNAAANGEELRLEPFLNSLQDVPQSWMASDKPWAQATGPAAWGDHGGDADRWGVDVKSMSSSAHGSATHTGSRTIASTPENDHAFVENFARQEGLAADADRKRKMHMFFKMPTHEKIKKIDEIVRYLQTASV
ncbi:hypothetical protein C8R43DRAFT_1030121 [Mycena crocata]|nr:hypothetical protein C8R43DRAFT_1030121 [Mycena crocata]